MLNMTGIIFAILGSLSDCEFGMVDPSIGKIVMVNNYDIFGQLKNKLASTHTIAIKLKETKDAMTVECHHAACVC